MSDQAANLKEQALAYNRQMQEFREKMEKRYAGDPAELKKLLLDLLCMVYLTDYVRPRG